MIDTKRVGGAAFAAWIGAQLLGAGVARADAVPPPMVPCQPYEHAVADHGGGHCVADRCPPGKVMTTSDEGYATCLPPAPKSCPTGWVGIPGPSCVLALCNDQAPCAAGLECRATPVCTLDVGGDGANEVDRAARGLFAGARMVMSSREYHGPCDAQSACSGAHEACRSVKVCLPKGDARAAARPDNGKTAKTWGKDIPKSETVLGSPTPPSSSPVGSAPGGRDASAPPSAPSASTPVSSPPPAAVPPKSGRGSAGCAVETGGGAAGATSSVVVLGLGLVAATMRARRRARRAS